MTAYVTRPTGSFETDQVFVVTGRSLEGRHVELVLTPAQVESYTYAMVQFLKRRQA